MAQICDRCDPPDTTDATDADIDPLPDRSWRLRCEAMCRERTRLCTAIASAVAHLAAIDGRAGQDVEMLVGCVKEDLEAALKPKKGAESA